MTNNFWKKLKRYLIKTGGFLGIFLLVSVGLLQAWLLISSFEPLFAEDGEIEGKLDLGIHEIIEEESEEKLGGKIISNKKDACVVNKKEIDVGQKPEEVIIPVLDLKLEIISVPLVDGTWEVHDYVANFAEGTSLPNGVSGNVGLFGHDRPHAFAPIKNLKVGDEIILKTDKYYFYYKVFASENVNPEKVDVFYPTEKPILTLLTCDGIFSESRYIVKGELFEIKLSDCVSL